MSTNQESSPLLRLQGRFDAFNTQPVLDWLASASAAGESNLLIDLSGVTFIDSTALAALVKGMKQCRERDGDLHLFGLLQPVRIIFELTRLDRALRIFDDETAARAAFNDGNS